VVRFKVQLPDFSKNTTGEFGKPNPPAPFPPLSFSPTRGDGRGRSLLFHGRGSRKAPLLDRGGVGEGSDPSVNSPTVSYKEREADNFFWLREALKLAPFPSREGGWGLGLTVLHSFENRYIRFPQDFLNLLV